MAYDGFVQMAWIWLSKLRFSQHDFRSSVRTPRFNVLRSKTAPIPNDFTHRPELGWFASQSDHVATCVSCACVPSEHLNCWLFPWRGPNRTQPGLTPPMYQRGMWFICIYIHTMHIFNHIQTIHTWYIKHIVTLYNPENVHEMVTRNV